MDYLFIVHVDGDFHVRKTLKTSAESGKNGENLISLIAKVILVIS